MPLTSLSAAGFPPSAGWCCLKTNWEKASKLQLWDMKNCTDPLLPSAAEKLSVGVTGWKTKECLPLREAGRRQSWRQLIKHIDQLAGLVSVRLIMLLVALPSSLSEEQWRFLLKMCAREGRKHEKKAFSYLCSTHALFLTIPECALRHSQPLQHCHAAQHTPGTPHSATMIFADRPSWEPSHHYWLNLAMSYKL